MKRFNASLSDIRQDIAGDLPLDLILLWNQQEKSEALHSEMLSPYLFEGIIACSDSAGLSKLSQKYTLPEVMKLVSEPKELLHAYGKAIGGEAIGIWAADNTQIVYKDIAVDTAVRQMLRLQIDAKELTVKIGLGMHFGKAYKIGGGLFGHDASHIEEIAEDHSSGGELLITKELYSMLSLDVAKYFTKKEDSENYSATEVNDEIHFKPGNDTSYPYPFDTTFFSLLKENSLESLSQMSLDEYREEKACVLISVKHEEYDFLLDYFTACLVAESVIAKAAERYNGTMVKSNGALGIFLFTDDANAVAFAKEAFVNLQTEGFISHIGISRGEVLLFPLKNGGLEISGNPVNIASKLAEDSGLEGICVHNTITLEAPESSPFEITCSGVILSGIHL